MAEALRSRRVDGEATYDRILEAAGEQFAANGFAETTSKEIAAHAGVDLASINYHFGGRNGLYQAVLVEARRRLVSRETLEQLLAAKMPSRAKLKHLIETIVDSMMARSNWHSRIVSREMLSPTSHWQALEQTEALPMLELALTLFEEITAIPAGHPALLRCFVCVTMACASLAETCRGSSVYGDRFSNMTRDVVIEHLYIFCLGGLKAIARDVEVREPMRC